MKILNFGSMNLDYVYQVPHFVRPGETLSAYQQTVNPGGKGLNQSIALSLAGADTHHAGCVGRGGEALSRLLAEKGVHTELICPVEELQGSAVIQVTPQGENAILLFGGSNRCVTREQIQDTAARFQAGDWLLVQNEMELLPDMVNAAFERGMNIALNPSPYNEALDGVDFHKLRWLLVNEVETGQLTGQEDPYAAWEVLHARYPELSAVVTLGSRGSVAFQVRDGRVETAVQRLFPVKAVDTTAAGDTYTGYFLAGLMEGLPLEACVNRAGKAASLSVTRPGAAESIPSREQVRDW